MESGWSHRFRTFVFDQKCVPWRVAQSAGALLEGSVRRRIPALYRRVRLGRWRDLVRPLTRAPLHHFYGYFDKSPWTRSGALVLAHEATFSDRPPEASDAVRVGVVPATGEGGFEPIAETMAWNWQQGSMLQWHPAEPDASILYNDRRDGMFVAVARDLRHGELRVYEKPFYAVTPDGKTALGVNFARLQRLRPGYGYAGLSDPWAGHLSPEEDGVYCMDLNTGVSEFVVSLSKLASLQPDASMRGAVHYVNHVQISREGRRFAFLHCWVLGKGRWGERLCVCDLDVASIDVPMPGAMVSHYDWIDDRKIVAWAWLPDLGGHYIVCDVVQRSVSVFAPGVLTENGHCSFSPDRRWLLTDTYPDRHGMRTLILFQPEEGRRTDLARLVSPRNVWGEIRCDLHPRWSRDGLRICIDSVHEESRQMYSINVGEFVS